MRQRYLVVLDPSDLLQPEPALVRAGFLAKETNATLELFISLNRSFYSGDHHGSQELTPENCVAEGLAWLDQLAEPLVKQGLKVATDVQWSRHAYDAIMSKVRSVEPTMVIKTTYHDSTLNRTLFNYTDWHLIRHCPCPLLLVTGEDHWSTRRIVGCVDPAHIHSQSETLDNTIIETAQMMAYRLRGDLRIFHSIEALPLAISALLYKDLADMANTSIYKKHQTMLADLLRPYGIGGHRVQITAGSPAQTIVPYVESIDASLLVMGAVSKGPLETWLIGNTAEKVLDALSCDVLVVKSVPSRIRVQESEWVNA